MPPADELPSPRLAFHPLVEDHDLDDDGDDGSDPDEHSTDLDIQPVDPSDVESSSDEEDERNYDVGANPPGLAPTRSASPVVPSRLHQAQPPVHADDEMEMDVDEDLPGLNGAEEAFLFHNPFVVPYSGQAGAPDRRPSARVEHPAPFTLYQDSLQGASEENDFAPFASSREWAIAQWAKTRGPSATAFDEFLAIEGVCDALKLTFKNTKELNKRIDAQLPSRPPFVRHALEVDGERYDLWLRDAMECVRVLFSSPDWAADLIVAPERHYTDRSKNTRIYGDMHTGNWWWRVQRKLEAKKRGATIVPLIISSDKTQLTLFRNRSCYPVYLTIGNIPKEIRRKSTRQGQLLIGYLPVTRLGHIQNDDTRRRAISNLFHACLRQALAPTCEPGRTGVAIASGNGTVYRCHPVFAAYVGDYPEI
ncbi:hypothetical protein EVJ58_g10163, partial [Rhodofomes roseus]